MAKFGTKKRPARGHVQTLDRAQAILAMCDDRGWTAVIGIEPDKPEDIYQFEFLIFSCYRFGRIIRHCSKNGFMEINLVNDHYSRTRNKVCDGDEIGPKENPDQRCSICQMNERT